jgi:hypothetical protein
MIFCNLLDGLEMQYPKHDVRADMPPRLTFQNGEKWYDDCAAQFCVSHINIPPSRSQLLLFFILAAHQKAGLSEKPENLGTKELCLRLRITRAQINLCACSSLLYFQLRKIEQE